MSILAIDYGKKRIGVAVSSTFISTPLKPVLVVNSENLLISISKIIIEYEVSEIVLGLPLNMDGTESEMTKEVRCFAVKLERKFGLKVSLVDERLTSREAEEKLAIFEKSWQKRKKKIDSAAACLILESYLRKKNEC
ncbi:MAG: Holliday junction resolvase RuvX [Elusimicrobia bacterium]|nr:Holliday junction resolvase RuvX [Elusimicrobiota bacterium]